MTIVNSIPLVGDPLDMDVAGNTIFVAEYRLGISLWHRTTGELLQRFDGLVELDEEDDVEKKMDVLYVSLTRYHAPFNILLITDRTRTHRIMAFKYDEKSNSLDFIRDYQGATNSLRDIVFEAIPGDNLTFRTFWGYFRMSRNNIQQGRIISPLYSHEMQADSTVPNAINSIVLAPDHILTAMGQRGVYITNRALTENVEFNTPVSAQDLVLNNNTLYVADSQGGLLVIDVSDMSEPKLIQTIQIEGSATSIDMTGRYLAVGTTNAGVFLYSIDSPVAPKLLAGLPNSHVGYINKLMFYNNELFIASRDLGIIRIRIN